MISLDLDRNISATKDKAQDINNRSVGIMFGWQIHDYCADQSIPLPKKGLFLGAGEAQAELALADELSIEDSQIFLLDKNPPERLKRQLSETRPEIQILTSSIFNFLRSPIHDTFSLVTFFGVEYVLDQTALNTVASLLPNILTMDAIVAITPFNFDVDDTWNKNGFQQITSQAGKLPLMRYIKK